MGKLRLALQFLCTLGLFCFVISHKRNERRLLKAEEDMDKLAFDLNNSFFALDMVKEKLENLTDDQSSVDIVLKTMTSTDAYEEEPTQGPADSSKGRAVELFRRVETKLSLVREFLAQESAVDQVLAGLQDKLDQEFPKVKSTVDDKRRQMEGGVDRQIGVVQESLATVDTYARSRNQDIAGAIYYGGIGSMCLKSIRECRLQDSDCYGGVCRCDPGFSYDALQQRCVDECRNYGDTFQLIPNYIFRGFNDLVLNDTSVEECKEACRGAAEFECRAAEYFPRWRKCFLSDLMSSNMTEDDLEYNSAGYLYSRDCAYY